jgi:hypothetical protein
MMKIINKRLFLPPSIEYQRWCEERVNQKEINKRKESDLLTPLYIMKKLFTPVTHLPYYQITIPVDLGIFVINPSESYTSNKNIKYIQYVYLHGNIQTIHDCVDRVLNMANDITKHIKLHLSAGRYDHLLFRFYIFEYPGYVDGHVENLSDSVFNIWCLDLIDVLKQGVELSPNSGDPIIILHGYSLGASMACKLMDSLFPMTSILILEGLFTDLSKIICSQVYKSYGFMASKLTPLFISNKVHEYFNSMDILKNKKGRTSITAIVASDDKLCGCCNDDIKRLEERGVIEHKFIIQGDHNSFLETDTTLELSEHIALTIENIIHTEPMYQTEESGTSAIEMSYILS